MKIIDGTVVCIYMEGILILIIKSERLVFQSLQKPHWCNREKEKQLFITVLTVYFFFA